VIPLQIEVFAQLDDIPRDLSERVEERAQACLKRHRSDLERLRVVLRDESAGVGCRLILDRKRGDPLVASAQGRELEVALALGLVRLRERLRRRVDRVRGRARRLRRAA
jgi:RNA 3'-terminal phosphate cyclase